MASYNSDPTQSCLPCEEQWTLAILGLRKDVCYCNRTALILRSQDRRNGNFGRLFHRCPINNCSLFTWAKIWNRLDDDEASSSTNGIQRTNITGQEFADNVRTLDEMMSKKQAFIRMVWMTWTMLFTIALLSIGIALKKYM